MTRIKRRRLKSRSAIRRRQQRRYDDTGASNDTKTSTGLYTELIRTSIEKLPWNEDEQSSSIDDIKSDLERLKDIERLGSTALRLNALHLALEQDASIFSHQLMAQALSLELMRLTPNQARLLDTYIDACLNALIKYDVIEEAIELNAHLGLLDEAYRLAETYGFMKKADMFAAELNFETQLWEHGEDWHALVQERRRVGDLAQARLFAEQWWQETHSPEAKAFIDQLESTRLSPHCQIKLNTHTANIRVSQSVTLGRGRDNHIHLKSLKAPLNVATLSWTPEHNWQMINQLDNTNALFRFTVNKQSLYIHLTNAEQTYIIIPTHDETFQIGPWTASFQSDGRLQLLNQSADQAAHYLLGHQERITQDGHHIVASRIDDA